MNHTRSSTCELFSAKGIAMRPVCSLETDEMATHEVDKSSVQMRRKKEKKQIVNKARESTWGNSAA
jgi:hypothetical protein